MLVGKLTEIKLPHLLKEVPEIHLNFEIINSIGGGTFGIVLLGVLKQDRNVKCALKYLIPTSCIRAQSEIEALQKIGKHSNVIELLTTVRHQDQVVLVFPYFEHDTFSSIIDTMNLMDIRFYMHSLLSGIAYVHSKGIVHQDIKPSNFLYNKRLQTGKLIDYGLVHLPTEKVRHRETTTIFKKPSIHISTTKSTKSKVCSHDTKSVCNTCLSRRKKVVPRAGTPGYRAPEILLQYLHQTNVIDTWSAGVILLSLLSQCYPFFNAINDCYAFGSNTCVQAAKSLGIMLYISEDCPGLCLNKICSKHKECEHKLHKHFLVLLKDMLCVNPLCRVSAAQALFYKAFVK